MKKILLLPVFALLLAALLSLASCDLISTHNEADDFAEGGGSHVAPDELFYTVTGTPLYAYSTETQIAKGMRFIIHDGRCTLTDFTSFDEFGNELVIPSEVNGVPVTKINLSDVVHIPDNSIQRIAIPREVEEIGRNAFTFFKNLTEVRFQSDSRCRTIGQEAFRNTSLSSFVIPASVETIGSKTFMGCKNLTSVRFERGSRCRTIGTSAFQHCSSLAKILIPAGVESIGSSAFASCPALTSAVFAEGSVCKTVDGYAFYRCTSLKTFRLPATVEDLGSGAFSGCTALKSFVFEEGSVCRQIGSETFTASAIRSIRIPASVQSIGGSYVGGCIGVSGAFAHCAELTEVVFEDNSRCEELGEQIFAGCNKLKTVRIPSSVRHIHSLAFADYTSPSAQKIALEEPSEFFALRDNCLIEKESGTLLFGWNGASIPDDGSVMAIAPGAFRGVKMKSCAIPGSVKAIGDQAFFAVTVDEIRIAEGVESIGKAAFWGAQMRKLSIPASVAEVGETLFYSCGKLTEIRYGGTLAEWDALFDGKTPVLRVGMPDHDPCFTLICSDGERVCNYRDQIGVERT